MDGSWWTCPTQTYSQSQLREVRRARVNPSTHTHAHTHLSIRDPVPKLAQYGAPLRHLLTPHVPGLDPDGWSSDPTVTKRVETDSRFFFLLPANGKLDPCPSYHYISS